MTKATAKVHTGSTWLVASAILLAGVLAAVGTPAAPTGEDALYINADGRVGIGTVEPRARVDIQDGERTGEHPAAVPGFYLTAPLEGARGIELRRSDGKLGIGLGSDTVYATGSDADQDLKLKARGQGTVKVEGDLEVGGLEVNGNLSAHNLTVTGTLEVTGTLKASRLQVPGLVVGTIFQVMTKNSATALSCTSTGDARCEGSLGSCGPASDTRGVWDHYCTAYRNGGIDGYCYFFHCISK
jgi:hypothetical protein